MKYDPFYANQQRFLMNQKQAIERQKLIYNKHMHDIAGPDALRRELDLKEENDKEERRKIMTQQLLE